MSLLRLGTRRSALAQAQAHGVTQRLRAAHRDLQVEILMLATSGDQSKSGPPPDAALPPGGRKTLFTKEIEEALLDKRIDLAVHSMKDVATQMPAGLCIGAVPEREDARDVWISKNHKSLRALASGARVGTGAVRRQAQLRHLNPALAIVPVHGNVDTRLARLASGDLDGLVLAWAGLARLGRETEATEILPTDVMLPAVGQGCLCLQIREGDAVQRALLSKLDHPISHQAVLAERAFLEKLGGDCHAPIAALAWFEKGRWQMDGLVASLDGQTVLREHLEFDSPDTAARGRQLAGKLLARGAAALLAHADTL